MHTPGSIVSCGSCGEVVYPDCHVLANHTVTVLDDGRCRWVSRDFNVVVHECESFGVARMLSADIHAALGTPVG